MNILNKLTAISIYPKLVMTFLIILSPLYVISWKMNLSGAATVKTEISNSISSRVGLYMSMLETDFDRAIRLLQDYINDDDLLNLSISGQAMSDIDRTEALLRLKYRLNLLKKSSKFIGNASAFIPGLLRTVSANDNIITDFDDDQFRALCKPTNRFESPFLLWKGRLFISVPYPEPATYSKLPTFLLVLEISKDELQSELREFTNEGGGAVLITKQLNWSVVGTDAGADPRAFQGLMDRTQAGFVHLSNKSYMVISNDSSRLNMTLYMYIRSEQIFGPLNSYRYWLYLLTMAAMVIVFLFSYSIHFIIQQPLRKLVHSFRRIEQGDLTQELHYSVKDEFSFLYHKFNAMVKRLNVLVHEVYEQRYRAQSAELRHLQSQINPHFLYNTYFILYRMAKLHDNENIVHYTKHLGEYFQYITRDRADEVPLENEVRHAITYTDIQSIRFSNRIRVDFGDLPAEAALIEVPRLILQPIIENAYHHGLEEKRKDGWVRIRFCIEPDRIVISVEDNGETLTKEKLAELRAYLANPDQSAESTGLLNVHRRIQIKYGLAGGLTLSFGVEGGLNVDMVIPLEKGKADNV